MDLFPLVNSLRIALISIVIVFFTGIFLANLIKKCPRVVKGICDVILTLPLVLPPTVCGYLLILIFGPLHPIGAFLKDIGIKFFMDWKGGILASAMVSFPLMYRTVRASFESFDENLASAGKTLGLSDTYIFWRIKLPACKSGLIAGTVLAFARALGEYGATQMFVGYTYKTATISTTVASLWTSGDEKTAVYWILLNIAIAAVVLTIVNIFENKEKKRRIVK